MELHHQHHRQESTSASLLPTEVEAGRTGILSPHLLLQMCCGEHPHLLHRVWHSSCTVVDKKALQRVVKLAQRISGCSLPAISDLYTSRCLRKSLLHHEGCHTAGTRPVCPPPIRSKAAQHLGKNHQTL